MTERKKGTADDRIARAMESDVPRVYFNGFVNGMSTGDIVTILEKNDMPVAILNMSFTVAKTLSVSLGQIIARLEEVSERPIMTTHEIESHDLEQVKKSGGNKKRKKRK